MRRGGKGLQAVLKLQQRRGLLHLTQARSGGRACINGKIFIKETAHKAAGGIGGLREKAKAAGGRFSCVCLPGHYSAGAAEIADFTVLQRKAACFS